MRQLPNGSGKPQEAYEVLKDEQKRAAYDRLGHAAFEQGGMGGGNPFGAGGNPFGGGFSDIFDQMFSEFSGRGGGGDAARQGLICVMISMSHWKRHLRAAPATSPSI